MLKFGKILLSLSFFFLGVSVTTTNRWFKFETDTECAIEKTVPEVAVTPVEDNWDKFIEAVIWKESRGNESCIGDSGKAVGVLQIHPIMVREANRILAMTDKSKANHYTYEDRYSREKSIEIFKIVQDYHNASHNHKKALDIWNKNHPMSYYTQIMDKYNELIS